MIPRIERAVPDVFTYLSNDEADPGASITKKFPGYNVSISISHGFVKRTVEKFPEVVPAVPQRPAKTEAIHPSESLLWFLGIPCHEPRSGWCDQSYRLEGL